MKLVFCLRRLPHVSREEFLDYWHNHHGPIALRFQKVMRLQKYVQLHTITTPFEATLREGRGGPDPFDGIAEAWWDSTDTLEKALSDPEAQAAWATLLEDEKRFIDLKHSPIWFVEERVMFSEKEKE